MRWALVKPLSLMLSGPNMKRKCSDQRMAFGFVRNLLGLVRLDFESEGGLFPHITGERDTNVDVANEHGRIFDKCDRKAEPIKCERQHTTGEGERFVITEAELGTTDCGAGDGIGRH